MSSASSRTAGSVPLLAADVAAELDRATSRAFSGEVLESPSEAELAVLRLLPSDLSAREIGGELFLSSNTVHTHTRAIYRKLRVSSRAEAVARAGELGLLGERGITWVIIAQRGLAQRCVRDGEGMPSRQYRLIVEGELSDRIGLTLEGMTLTREGGEHRSPLQRARSGRAAGLPAALVRLRADAVERGRGRGALSSPKWGVIACRSGATVFGIT